MIMSWVMRTAFAVLAFVVGMWLKGAWPQIFPGYFPYLMAALAVAIVGVEIVFEKRYLRSAVAVVLGLAIGVSITWVIVALLILFSASGDFAVRIKSAAPFVPVIALFVCYLSVTIVLHSKDQFRFIVPYLDFRSRRRSVGDVLLDTSAIIDGRILELILTGLVDARIVAPEFVVKELHKLADSADRSVRERGKRGLDNLATLRAFADVEVRIDETDFPELVETDAKLVRLALVLDARLITCDSNLARITTIEGATATNLNEIAEAMRPVYLPGDTLSVTPSRAGEQPGQAVAFLPDGTMIVIENARKLIGRELEVEVTNLRQTAAGRMLFAKPTNRGRRHVKDAKRAEDASKSPGNRTGETS